MNIPLFNADTTIAEALEGTPGITKILIARRTACIGCSLARFCTLRETAAAYRLPWDAFINDLRRAASETSQNTGGVNA
ncbi:MAG: hypothetical protein V1755_04570 [Chloroflexota bacterium]